VSGKTKTPALGEHDVVIARIARARGIRGEVACDLETDFPERFEQLGTVTLVTPGGQRRDFEIENHWFHKGRVILKFAGVDSMNEAQALAGAVLVIDEADHAGLDEGEFFIHQIVGSNVFSSDGREIGTIVSLMKTGGTDVLVVRSTAGRELLIPFAEDICEIVDPEAKRIVVNEPEGLFDL